MITVLTPPETLAVTLTSFKQFLHITHGLANQNLAAFLLSAQTHLEDTLALKFINQKVAISFANERLQRGYRVSHKSDTFTLIKLPLAPLGKIEKVSFVSETDPRDILPCESYKHHTHGLSHELLIPFKRGAHLTVEATVGFGATEDDVPSPLRLAIMMVAQSYYRGGDPHLAGLRNLLLPYLKRGI